MNTLQRIIEQHAEDASFLWLLRGNATDAPHYTLFDLAALDGRIEAHLDGLRVAGEEGWRVCLEALEWREPGEVFAAAVIALQNANERRFERVAEVTCNDADLTPALVSALAWSPTPQTTAALSALVSSSEAQRRRVGVAACGAARRDPGSLLVELLRDSDPGVQARAARAAAELGRVDALPQLERLLSAPGDVRHWAAWAATRLGGRSSGLRAALREAAATPGPVQLSAAQMYVRTVDVESAKGWITEAWRDPERRRLAVVAVGWLGLPESVDALLPLMESADLARVAGESFATITGVDLARDEAELDAPDGLQFGPSEAAGDDGVALDPDEDLPWPDPATVEEIWSARAGDFVTGRRYLCGREVNALTLARTLREGVQRQRAAAALELALRSPRESVFEVRARGDLQRVWLGL